MKKNKKDIKIPPSLTSSNMEWVKHFHTGKDESKLKDVIQSLKKKPKITYKGIPVKEKNNIKQVFSQPLTADFMKKLNTFY